MTARHLRHGRIAERLAWCRLRAAGLECVQRNFRCRFGELDLIMNDGEILCFVEVRYRRRGDFGSAAESVSTHKRRRLIAAARHFLGHHAPYQMYPCRFDVVAVSGRLRPRIEWLTNAFTLDDA